MKQYRFNQCSMVLFSVIFLIKIEKIFSTDTGESSSGTGRVTRFENIVKAPNDDRSYRGLKLDNELEILFISSPLSEASVAMSVGAGSLNDFDELPGIAHLVGEMLDRSGTLTYPEQDFLEIINVHLPSAEMEDDAWFPETEEEGQIFCFETSPEDLARVLEIFAQFFNEPLLPTLNSRNLLEDCIEHIEWWYSSVVLNESGPNWRFRQLKKSISAEDHPFSHCTYGDADTFVKYLGEEERSDESEPNEGSERRPTILYDKIREFHSTWYSSNNMRLVVLGKKNLDELERITVPLFQNIPNKNVKKLTFSYEQHPWTQEQLKRKIYSKMSTVSSSNNGVVRVVFRAPNIRHQYKTAPELYVSDVLMRGGPGNLISVLKERKLCHYLKADYDTIAGIGFFNIKCEVPRDSEMRENEIVELIIQYIRLLKKEGIRESIFNENKMRYKKSFSRNYYRDEITTLAFAMHVYPMEDILSYKYPHDWNSSFIEDFLAYLTPDNMNVFIETKELPKTSAEEVKWHNIPYNVEIIPEHLLQRWKTVEILPDLKMPQVNKFMVENEDIYPVGEEESEIPYIIHESRRSRVWFAQNDQYSKVAIKIDLINLNARLKPSNPTLLCIFSHLLEYHVLAEYGYDFDKTEYDWSTDFSEISTMINVYGYPSQMHTVLESTLLKIKTNHFVGKHLQDQFEKAKVDCINRRKLQMTNLTVLSRFKYVLTEPAHRWSHGEIINASKSLQLKDWENFISEMLPRVYIQTLIFGNCLKQNAINIARIIESSFKYAAKLIPQAMASLLPRIVEIEEGKHFLDLLFKDAPQKSNPHNTYYQFGTETIQNNIISTLLYKMIISVCNSIMVDNRVLYVNIFKIFSEIGLLFSTFSKSHLHDYVDSQFEDCLRKLHVFLQEMTDMELEKYTKNLIEKESSAPVTIVQHWDNLTRGCGSFRPDDHTTPITKMDLLAFFEEMLSEHSPKRRKYTVIILPRNAEYTSLRVIQGTTLVDDAITFKNHSSLLPMSSSYWNFNFA